MDVFLCTTDRGGKAEVCLKCKTSEKIIPQSVVRQSELLKAVKYERRTLPVDFPWSAVCNWASIDPWEDPGCPSGDLCRALQVADFMDDGEITTRASLITERLRLHIPVAPTPRSSAFGSFLSSFKRRSRNGSGIPGRANGKASPSHARGGTGTDAAPPDAPADVLQAIDQLPIHLIRMVLEPFDLVTVLRLLSDVPRPKLVLALRSQGPKGSLNHTPEASLADLPSMVDLEVTTGSLDAGPQGSGLASRSQASLARSDKDSVGKLDSAFVDRPAPATPDVQTLSLSHVGSRAAELLAPQLCALHHHLTPSNPAFGPPQTLVFLDLSHNSLGAALDARKLPPTPRGTKATTRQPSTALDVVASHITAATALQGLNLSFNSLSEPASLANLVAALQPLEWLQVLDLSHNLIDSEAAIAASEHLAAVTGLTSLKLQSNYIGATGAKALTEAVFVAVAAADGAAAPRAVGTRSSSVTGLSNSEPPPEAPAGSLSPQPEEEESLAVRMQRAKEEEDKDAAEAREAAAHADGRGEKGEFMRAVDTTASPLEHLDLSHNDLEPPGLLAVTGSFAHARGGARHLRHIELGNNCRSHERHRRALLANSSSIPLPHNHTPAKPQRQWNRVPTGDALPATTPADVVAMHTGDASTALKNGADMLEALVAMAPNLVASNLPRLAHLHVSEHAAVMATGAGIQKDVGVTYERRDVFMGQVSAVEMCPRGSKRNGLTKVSSRLRSTPDAGALRALSSSIATFALTLLSLDLRGLPLFAGGAVASGALVSCLGELKALTRLNLSATRLGEGIQACVMGARRAALRQAKLLEASAGSGDLIDVSAAAVHGNDLEGSDDEGAIADSARGEGTISNNKQVTACTPAVAEGVVQKTNGHAPSSRVAVAVGEGQEEGEDDLDVCIPDMHSGEPGAKAAEPESAKSVSTSAAAQTAAAASAVECSPPPAPPADVATGDRDGSGAAERETDKEREMRELAERCRRLEKMLASTQQALTAAGSPEGDAVAAGASASATGVLARLNAENGIVSTGVVAPSEAVASAAATVAAQSRSASASSAKMSAAVDAAVNACIAAAERRASNTATPTAEPRQAQAHGLPDASRSIAEINAVSPAGASEGASEEPLAELEVTGELEGEQAPQELVENVSQTAVQPVEEEEEVEEVEEYDGEPLTAFLGVLKELKVLDISLNNLGLLREDQEAAEELGRHLGAIASLQELRLGGNGLAAAAVPVTTEVSKLQRLQALQLENNAISGTEMMKLAPAVVAASALTRLALNGNRVGVTGTKASQHGGSHAYESGVGGITRCVEELPCLRRLEVNSNGIGQEEAEGLMAAVAKARTLRCVHLRQEEKLDPVVAKGYLSSLEEWVV